MKILITLFAGAAAALMIAYLYRPAKQELPEERTSEEEHAEAVRAAFENYLETVRLAESAGLTVTPSEGFKYPTTSKIYSYESKP